MKTRTNTPPPSIDPELKYLGKNFGDFVANQAYLIVRDPSDGCTRVIQNWTDMDNGNLPVTTKLFESTDDSSKVVKFDTISVNLGRNLYVYPYPKWTGERTTINIQYVANPSFEVVGHVFLIKNGFSLGEESGRIKDFVAEFVKSTSFYIGDPIISSGGSVSYSGTFLILPNSFTAQGYFCLSVSGSRFMAAIITYRDTAWGTGIGFTEDGNIERIEMASPIFSKGQTIRAIRLC